MTGAVHLPELAGSQARLLARLARLDDDEARAASALPGWPRDLLLAHLRFGAEAVLRGIEGSGDGTPALMYPGGEAQRDAEIASGSGRPARELVADLTDACDRLERTLAGLPDDGWDAPVQTRRGPVAVSEVLLQRWLDVEVHHVDLCLGYTVDDWPAALVEIYLPKLVELLPAMHARPDADRSVSGSWHLHRSDGPGEWTLRVDGDAVSIEPEHAKADSAIQGTGRALLALLLGRWDIHDLTVFGDLKHAETLKSVFPGP